MDIQVGDRITFINSEGNNVIAIINNNAEIQEMKEILKTRKLVKIERPKYEVIEEKKELLTDEEKEFLKSYIKFVESFKNEKVIEINKNGNWLVLTLKTGIEYQVEVGFKYENIPYYKIALKELGLE